MVLGKTLIDDDLYSFALDFDGIDAVMEFSGSWDNVLSLSKRTRIEWHQDKGRLHIVFFSNKNVTKKRIKVKEAEAAFEVRCHELLIASPCINGDGNPWSVLPGGTDQIAVLDEVQLLKLEAKIDSLSSGYMSDEDKQHYIAWLEDPSTIIKEGGRHDGIKTLGCSYYYRYNNGWKDLTDDQKHDKLQEWNLQHCIPPSQEIWKWIVSTHRKSRDAEKIGNNRDDPLNIPGCIFYLISTSLSIWITGTPDNKLIEVMRKTEASDDGLLTVSFVTKKTFTFYFWITLNV